MSLGTRTGRRSDATDSLEGRLKQLEKSSGLNDCRENKTNRNVTIPNNSREQKWWKGKIIMVYVLHGSSCEQCLHRHNNVNTDY